MVLNWEEACLLGDILDGRVVEERGRYCRLVGGSQDDAPDSALPGTAPPPSREGS